MAEISEDIGEIKADLKYHIKRCDLLEESVTLLRTSVENDLKPIKAHVVFLNNTLKLVGAVGFVVGLIAGLSEILSYFSVHIL